MFRGIKTWRTQHIAGGKTNLVIKVSRAIRDAIFTNNNSVETDSRYQRGACQAGAGQRWCQVSSVGEAMSDGTRGTRAMLLLGKMDNAGFVSDGRAVEMEPVVSNGTPVGCSDQCLAMHRKSQNTPKKPTESPWHHWKTIFLVVTMVALTVWIIVYTVLSQMGLL
uniref:(California timema) hypothetical protein n=1 Tax=Timema californicum TaxID=61474 RepID=A0A7R9PCD5_TIMCA|nr:unnamed protein product [Timema californicum]